MYARDNSIREEDGGRNLTKHTEDNRGSKNVKNRVSADPVFVIHPVSIFFYILALLSLRLLLTTKTLLKAMAPAASIGFRSPSAAAGIKMTL